MVDVFGSEFSHLKVNPVLAQEIVHSDIYIKNEIEGIKTRGIFNNVSYDQEEKEKIKLIESLAQVNNINHPLFCQTGQILKYLYGNLMDPNKAFQNMIDHLKWIEDPNTFSLAPLTTKFLKEGYIYLGGTDKQMRPTIIFNVDKINLKEATEETILPTYNRIFKIAEEYYFYKSKIESWNVIIETNDVSALNLPISILGKIISTMQNNFPSNLNRIYILNPSISLNFSWKVIAAFISKKSLKKIEFLKKNEIKKMLNTYDSDQLEERFGGTAPNVTIYYPPVAFQPNKAYELKAIQSKGASVLQSSKDSIEATPSRNGGWDSTKMNYIQPGFQSNVMMQQQSEIYSYRSQTEKESLQNYTPSSKQIFVNPSTFDKTRDLVTPQQSNQQSNIIHLNNFESIQKRSQQSRTNFYLSAEEKIALEFPQTSFYIQDNHLKQTVNLNKPQTSSEPLRFTKSTSNQSHVERISHYKNLIPQNQQDPLNSQISWTQKPHPKSFSPENNDQSRSSIPSVIKNQWLIAQFESDQNSKQTKNEQFIEGPINTHEKVKRTQQQKNESEHIGETKLRERIFLIEKNPHSEINLRDDLVNFNELQGQKYNACSIF